MLRHAAALAATLATALALEDVSDEFYAESEAAGRGVSNATMQGVLLQEAAQKTGAVCLDGSPGMVYVRKGTGDGANKWYIHHQGGGWCESLDDCLGRSKGGLGSSKGYGKTSAQNSGYFSTSPAENPMMYNWNSVFMPYCDGGYFAGNRAGVEWTNFTGTFSNGTAVVNASVYASRAVQFHPNGGQFGFVWLSALTPHVAYVWRA